jgi:alkylation response protein AidB-like acyl-CoA dehydrogenase
MRLPLPDDELVWGGRNAVFWHPDAKRWLHLMADKGWTAPQWPKEFGGAGLTAEEAEVLDEEMRRLDCRPPLKSFGLTMLGPILLQYGTEEQKRRYLPDIAAGRIRWCQGFSEPMAGSDLASVQTRAIHDEDTLVITGHKVWTSYAHKADWMYCLVRTAREAKPQDGMSFLLLDMSTPGIRVEPIQLISGRSIFCEVFFENVRVPAENVVGTPGEGWTVAKSLLRHERLSIARGAGQDRVELREVIDLIDGAASLPIGTSREALRDRAVTWMMEEHALRLLQQRVAVLAQDPEVDIPDGYTSILKYCRAKSNQERWDILLDATGPGSLALNDQNELSAIARNWLRARGNSIEGGTSEIQLNIIAKRMLGLPSRENSR